MADPERTAEQIAADALIACHRRQVEDHLLPSREAEGRFVVAVLTEAGLIADPDERDRLREIIAAVEALHAMDPDDPDMPWCERCDTAWPCPTRRAISERAADPGGEG